jgi:protein SCO1
MGCPPEDQCRDNVAPVRHAKKERFDMQAKTIAITATGLVVTGLVATLIATTIARPVDAFAACRAGAVAGGDIGGPFELVNAAGATVTDKDVITTPSIIYFGYTFCPDVCPLDNMRNAQAVEILEERGIIATPVFISIDPERDTPEVVGTYAQNFHDRMIGLTGSPAQVDAASKAYRTFYRKQDSTPDDPYYLVDHSVFSYLVLPEIGFVDFVGRDDTPEALADKMACFVDAAGI